MNTPRSTAECKEHVSQDAGLVAQPTATHGANNCLLDGLLHHHPRVRTACLDSTTMRPRKRSAFDSMYFGSKPKSD